MWSKIKEFFIGIEHLLLRVFSVVQEIVPHSNLVQAIELVKTAADKFTDNADRREWVALELMNVLHIPESVARLTTELAVMAVKRGVDTVAIDLEK